MTTINKKVVKRKELPNPDFYTATYYDEEKKKVKRISVQISKLVHFLSAMGFQRYDQDGDYFYIKLENNVVDEVDQTLIIDQFEDTIELYTDPLPGKYEIPKQALFDSFYRNIGTYFSQNILNRMRAKEEVIFAEDTKNSALFFYQNGYTKVTADKVELLTYDSLKGKKVWHNQILERNFTKKDIGEFVWCNWGKFVNFISNNYHKELGGGEDVERVEVLKSIIGYNLHKYFHGKLKSTIFTDSTISENASGRSGKTLLLKGLGKMLNQTDTAKTFIEISGKGFEFTDRFRYQECRLSTKLIHLNDVTKKFQFELLFNDISEGVRAQRKNQEPFLVNSKIVISTNRTIKIDGDSAEDRAVEFEMSSYFNAKHSPLMEFDEWFFTDWNENDWANFDNFMMHCVQVYFRRGVIKPSAINLNRRKLIEETCPEFVLWMDEWVKDAISSDFYDKNDIKLLFYDSHPDFNKLAMRTFTKWLRLYTKFSPDYVEWCDSHDKQSNGKYQMKFERLVVEPRA